MKNSKIYIKNSKIYNKTAPTCFGLLTIISELIVELS